MYNSKNLAANVRKARLLRNYSQDYMALKLDISQNGYSKIELGYSTLSVDRLMAIAHVLAVDVKQLLGMPSIISDAEGVENIPICQSLLDVICHTTGLGFAAIARVTEERWVACSVADRISFGLRSGDELPIATTICNEIRESKKVVVIDDVAKDATFAHHPTPAMYGFQSYISVPVFRQDETFFGTLFAIDPKPAKLNNPETIAMFKLFAQLISFHLDAMERSVFLGEDLDGSQKAGLEEQLIAMLGKDLPQPVRKVLDQVN